MPRAIKSDAELAGPGKQMRSVLPPSLLIALAAIMIFAAAHAVAQTKPPAQPLDLNTATVEQLEQLPGIRKDIAEAIVKFREKSGPFQRVEELRAIRGISEARFEKIRPYVTVNPPAHTPH